jgi:hypothetical protein
MTEKGLLTAALLVPLIALSGVAYARGGGGGGRISSALQISAQAQNQTVASKPYAQYVAAKEHWTGPKHNQYHRQAQ